MKKNFTLTKNCLVGLLLGLLSQNVQAQVSMFDLTIFDPKIMALGQKEDSLLLADEISFALEQKRMAAEEQARQESARMRLSAERPVENSASRGESEPPGRSRSEKLADFPPHVAKRVPRDAIFLQEETGGGISITDLDANNAIMLIEDKYQERLTIRLEKLRVSALTIRAYGLDGRLAYNTKIYQKPKGYEFDINIKEWPKGIYRFQFKVDDGRWQEKVLVKSSFSKKRR